MTKAFTMSLDGSVSATTESLDGGIDFDSLIKVSAISEGSMLATVFSNDAN